MACSGTGAYTIITTVPPVTYKINYVLNGGTNNSINSLTYQNTSATFSLKNPSRKGYLFAGWYTDAGFAARVSQVKNGTKGDLVFYAKWLKVTVSRAKIPIITNPQRVYQVQ